MHGKVNCFKKGPPSQRKNLNVKDKYERRERFVDFKFSKDDRYLLGYTNHNEYFMWGITNTLLKGSMKPIFSRECDLIKSFDFYNDEMIFLIQRKKVTKNLFRKYYKILNPCNYPRLYWKI